MACAVNAQPTIKHVVVAPSSLGTGNFQMVIKGSGFGALANPPTTVSPYLRIYDVTQGSWEAGYRAPGAWFGDLVNVDITSWTDGEIDIAGFTGWAFNSLDKFNSGDQLQVQVQNPITQDGWASSYVTLSPAFLVIEIFPPTTNFPNIGPVSTPMLLDNTEMTSLLNAIGEELIQSNLNPTAFAVSVEPNTSGNTETLLADIVMEAPLDITEAITDFSELGVWGVSTELGEDYAFSPPTPLDCLSGEISPVLYAINSQQAQLMRLYGCWRLIGGTYELMTSVPYVVQCGQKLTIVVGPTPTVSPAPRATPMAPGRTTSSSMWRDSTQQTRPRCSPCRSRMWRTNQPTRI
jgi:hypothetical protein